MKKFLLSSAIIISCCFFAEAGGGTENNAAATQPLNETGGNTLPPLNLLPPPPSLMNRNDNKPDFLKDIGVPRKLKKVSQNTKTTTIDLQDEDYNADDFDWSSCHDRLLKFENKKTSFFDDLLKENKKPQANLPIFVDEQSNDIPQNDDHCYYITQEMAVKDLFPDIIQFAQKKVNFTFKNKENKNDVTIEFSCNDYKKVLVFSRLLQSIVTQIDNNLQTILFEISKICEPLDSLIASEGYTVSSELNENLKDLKKTFHDATKAKVSFIDFYLKESARFDTIFAKLYKNNNDILNNLKKQLKEWYSKADRKKTIKELKEVFNKQIGNIVYQKYCLDLNIAEEKLSLSYLNSDGKS